MNEIQKTFPRDVFLYLLSIVALGISAVAFGTLLFQYINIYLPDSLTNSFRQISSYFQPIRWAVASLVVVFPVYVWISWFLRKDLLRYPEKREIKIRKWLLYLTLFVAAIIIIIDLITLVFNYLQGGLTLQFLLKIASVLFIAGAIFVYYLWNLKREELAISHPRMRIFVWMIIAAVTVATITGFVVAGSPQSERARRFDERRVRDLQLIQNEVIYFWQGQNRLPESLGEISFAALQDPETGKTYEYNVTGDLNFELCSTFQTSNLGEGRGERGFEPKPLPVERLLVPLPVRTFSWEHETGRTCFEWTINPELYSK